MPFVQPDHPIHLCREPLVMGRDEGRTPFTPDQPEEFREHAVGSGFVQIAGRLIGKDERRLVRKGPGDGHALLFSPRKLGRAMVESLIEAQRTEKLVRSCRGRRSFYIPDQLRKDDILSRRELGKEMVKLIDEAERLASKLGATIIVELGRFLAEQPDRSLESALEQSHGL